MTDSKTTKQINKMSLTQAVIIAPTHTRTDPE